MIEMMKMLEEAKDDLEIAEEKVDYLFYKIRRLGLFITNNF
jgi:hypothetical protein